MDAAATATLYDGTKVKGRLTTEHAASSYNQPVFVGDDGQAYDWAWIADVDTATEMRRRAGSATSERKAAAARANGRKGGRPRKQGSDT